MSERRIIHLLPGDALVDTFTEAGIAGEILVCRECLADGPKNAVGDEFWNVRARFIAESFGVGEESYHEKSTREFRTLREAANAGAEINLWFEYELFCQANYWFCLDFLRSGGASLYRVLPIFQDRERIWFGFSKHQSGELREAFACRVPIGDEDLELGSRLWAAYSKGDRETLEKLADSKSAVFPFLDEVVVAAVREGELPHQVLREILDSGISDFGEVFAEFRNRLGVYGYGDEQVRRILNQLN